MLTGIDFVLAAIVAAVPAWVATMAPTRGDSDTESSDSGRGTSRRSSRQSSSGVNRRSRRSVRRSGPVKLDPATDDQRVDSADGSGAPDDDARAAVRRSHEQLAADVLTGDPEAVRRFHDEFADRLHQFFVVRVGHARVDAEDLLQDTLIAALNGLPNRRGESSLWTWLMSVARRKLVDFYRARSRRPAFVESPDEHTDGARLFERLVDMDVVERMTLEVDLPRLVRMAITRLTPAQQELLSSMYDEELSVRDLAERHSLTAKAAESALYRAREAFKSSFAEIWRSAHGTDHPVVESSSRSKRK